jgi:drug/metabolite transporter (DMT)-like permease
MLSNEMLETKLGLFLFVSVLTTLLWGTSYFNETMMRRGVNPLTIIIISTLIAVLTTIYNLLNNKNYDYKIFIKDTKILNFTNIAIIIGLSIIIFYSKITASVLLKHHGTSTYKMLGLLLNLLLGGVFIYVIKKQTFSNLKLAGYILILCGSLLYSLN